MSERGESAMLAADPVQAFLCRYEDQLRRSLSGRAEIERGVADGKPAIGWVAVDPEVGGAHLEWFERANDSIDVEIGFGGNWHLPWTMDGASQLGRIVDAVIAGRITTFDALGCSRVEVTMEDGTVLVSTYRDRLLGRLPLDALRQRFALIGRYDPY